MPLTEICRRVQAPHKKSLAGTDRLKVEGSASGGRKTMSQTKRRHLPELGTPKSSQPSKQLLQISRPGSEALAALP